MKTICSLPYLWLIACFAVLLNSNVAYANDAQPVRLGDYVLPSILSEMLENGLSVPVYLQYKMQDGDQKSQQKIAEAELYVKDGSLYVASIQLDESSHNTVLSNATQQAINLVKDRKVDQDLKLSLNENAVLSLDLISLHLKLVVDESAIGTRFLNRTDRLGASSAQGWNSVLNYRLGTYYNFYDQSRNSSSYLNLNHVSSYKENHFILNATGYGLGGDNPSSNLHRALYERDADGYRFAVGMMDTWSMQSISSLNAVNSSKVYGVSFGNMSSSVSQNNHHALTPITVFLPSSGTVQLYREGRLLSIQNFEMGRHEVDTSTFPVGVYSIDVKIMVNGEEVSSTIAQVNKSYQRKSSNTQHVEWQMFGGKLNYNKAQLRQEDHAQREQDAWLLGMVMNKNFAWWSGVTLRPSIYAISNINNNDKILVTELDTNLSITQNFNLSMQSMLSSDESFRKTLTANYNLPRAYGNLWGALDKSDLGKKVFIEKRENYNVGINLNLNQIHASLGMLNGSYAQDLRHDNNYFNVEYNQNLVSLKFAELGFRAGMVKSKDHGQALSSNNSQDKYVHIEFKMPFSKWFNVGLNSRNDHVLATASAKKLFDHSVVKNAGIELSKVVKQKQQEQDRADNPLAVAAYMGYESKYNTGSLTASLEGDRHSISYTSQGTVAYADQKVALNALSLDAGVMIHTGLEDQAKMSAIINGQTYQLSGKNNFIALTPYQEYLIELANDQKSLSSVNIIKGRSSRVTLYPGNVAVLKPELQQLITIFGRIHDSSGELAQNAPLNNHIGKTVTDEFGEFSIDIDKRYPVLTLTQTDGTQCESQLTLNTTESAIWLGDLYCQTKNSNARLFSFQHHAPAAKLKVLGGDT